MEKERERKEMRGIDKINDERGERWKKSEKGKIQRERTKWMEKKRREKERGMQRYCHCSHAAVALN